MKTVIAKSQSSRSKEARKARRIVRTSLRYAIMVTAPELDADEQAAAQAKLDAMEKDVEKSLDFLASIKRERKVKVAKAKRAEKARVEQTEALPDAIVAKKKSSKKSK